MIIGNLNTYQFSPTRLPFISTVNGLKYLFDLFYRGHLIFNECLSIVITGRIHRLAISDHSDMISVNYFLDTWHAGLFGDVGIHFETDQFNLDSFDQLKTAYHSDER